MEEVEGVDIELLSFLQAVRRLEYILIHLVGHQAVSYLTIFQTCSVDNFLRKPLHHRSYQ